MTNELNMKVFAQRLKEARTNSGMTQKELADLSGVSTVMISAYEQADKETGKNPAMSSVYSIATVLNISIDWLCGLSDDMTIGKNSTVDYLKLFIDTSIYLQPVNHLMPKNTTTYKELFYDSKKNLIWNIPLKNNKETKELINDISRIRSIMQTGVATEDMISALINNLYKKYKDIDLDNLFYYKVTKVGEQNGNNPKT